MLDEYVFVVAEDFTVLKKAGFRDDAAAEQEALRLNSLHRLTIECYKLVCTCEYLVDLDVARKEDAR